MKSVFSALAILGAAQAARLDHEFAFASRGAPMVRQPRPAPRPAPVAAPMPTPAPMRAPTPAPMRAPEPVMMAPPMRAPVMMAPEPVKEMVMEMPEMPVHRPHPRPARREHPMAMAPRDVRHFEGERHHEPTWHPERNVPEYNGPHAGIYRTDKPEYLNVITDKKTDPLNGSVGYGVYRPNMDQVEEKHGYKSVKTAGRYNRYGRTADRYPLSKVSHFTAKKQVDLDPWGFDSGSELAAKITPVTLNRFRYDPYGPEVTPVTFAPARYNHEGEKAMPALVYDEPNHTPEKYERAYVPSFARAVDAEYRPRYKKTTYTQGKPYGYGYKSKTYKSLSDYVY